MTPECQVIVLDLRIEIPVRQERFDCSESPPDGPPLQNDPGKEGRKWDPPYPPSR
ncbi:hypothetical protein R3X27_14220 [Tropicimonas sp. TH_r6]|uniref:hypothetical protein n=1 Tax=Tropicimonas sp. TH_r6 TaxID=3082085 RepID=UPI00295484CB|nr:hypothetical protein [Tropicimonas sp. TH_r6]MDV7143839.1 hypothetical protein [Tropicimonas sp. TH_r6]